MKKFIILLMGVTVIALLVNCSKNNNAVSATASSVAAGNALPLTVLSPADNPSTADKIQLGRLLFWDPLLSGAKDVACASCHHASLGYTDNIDLAIGSNGIGFGVARHFNSPNTISFARRNTPSIINTAFNGISTAGNYNPLTAVMFFDNRVKSLELQCQGPIQTLEEMTGHAFGTGVALDSVVNRVRAIPEYQQLFATAFGTDNVSAVTIGKAIAAFERSIVATNSAYDKFMRGDLSAMTALQQNGLHAFINNGCSNCHNGPMFSDYQLHVLSVPDNAKRSTDSGAAGTYAFRTPSLRNLGLSAPYMHSGVFTSLAQVLDFYDKIGDGHSQNGHVPDSKLDGNLKRINKNDVNSIVQFLQSLNDNSFDKTIPATVPSKLHPGGNL